MSTDTELAPLPSISRLGVRVYGEAGAPPAGIAREDTLAAEVPVALVFNGLSHAVMMATPQELEDFALGFALSEGILDAADDCRGIEVEAVDAYDAGLPEGMPGVEVRLEISTRAFERLKGRRRSLAGRTGCGVCGVESFAALDLASERLPAHDWLARIDLPTVLRAFSALPARQLLNASAGAIHAAGWATLEGELVEVLEDVGRHNALDKLVGALAANEVDAAAGFIAVTSRASFEMVQKAAMAGVSLLAAVSAPTSFAVETAQRAGLTLVGFARREDLGVYSHPQRLPADTVPAAANGQRPH